MLNKFTNEEITKLFRQISAAYTIKGVNRFRIIAYDKAAETIEKSNIDVKDLWEEGRLSELPGIGQTITGHLNELFKTGKIRHFEDVFKDLPKGMLPLLDVAGFGPKKAYKLSLIFNLNNPQTVLDDLLKIAKSGKIAKLEGFGVKSESDIIESLERAKKGQVKEKRMPLPYASASALLVLDYLKKNPQTLEVYPLGSLRRQVSTIGDIDIAVSTEQPENVVQWFIKYPKKSKIIEVGPRGATILLESGQQIDLRVQYPQSFGSMLQYFTGSKSHNIHLREYAIKKGLSLSEYGIKITEKISGIKLNPENYNKKKSIYEYRREKEFYQALDLPWIAPELREDWGEIEAAQKNQLPSLIERSQIKGEVHVHSNFNLNSSHDLGASSVKELLKEAAKMNYQYLGISDHNPSFSNHTEKEIIAIMKGRKAKFEQILLSNKNIRVKLFIMLEIDILPDGQLALPDRAFDYIDAAVVSVHSSFTQDKDKMTKRIIKGLSNPKSKILAHPTGRLISKREGYDAHWQEIFDYCRSNNKALEINSYPDRLDLADSLVKRAIENRNKLIINSDSHHKDQLQLIDYGIAVARR
ncbi:hypothetical protein A2W14_01450, partial [Candidatus Gottesmanbacteria bacterium RBG_16_37_8]